MANRCGVTSYHTIRSAVQARMSTVFPDNMPNIVDTTDIVTEQVCTSLQRHLTTLFHDKIVAK